MSLKEYRKEDLIAGTDFMLAFFPFYKVVDRPTLNMYSVMSCGDINLSFYNQTSVSSMISCSSMVRTAQGAVLKQTKYHKINSSFDFVEVMSCVGGCIGGTGQPTNDAQTLQNRKSILLKDQTKNFALQNKIALEYYKNYSYLCYDN